MSFSVKGNSKDERLDAIMELVKEAGNTLFEALKSCEYGLRFKAFTIKPFEGEHAKQQMETLTDTIGASLIVHIQNTDREIAKAWDLDLCAKENEEGYTEIWIHAVKAGEKNLETLSEHASDAESDSSVSGEAGSPVEVPNLY